MKGKVRIDGRKNTLTKKGFPIIFYLTQDTKDKTVGTGFYAFKEQWDAGNSLPLPSHPDYLEVLNFLEIAKIRLRKLISEASTRYISLAAAERMLKHNSGDTFYGAATAYLDRNKMHLSYRLALRDFNRLYPDLGFASITPAVADSFAKGLLRVPTKKGARSPNGVNAYLTRLSFLWRQTSDIRSPFKGVRVKGRETPNKALTDDDLVKLRAADFKIHNNSTYGGVQNYINYWLLCFYLGGIDLVDLVGLTRDNVVNGRVEFMRSKGNSNVFVSNKIFPEAQLLLDRYVDPKRKTLIPVGRDNLIMLHTSIRKRQEDIRDGLRLSRKLYSKSARYTFINRGMNLLVDERVCAEIVGHKEQSTHSIYKGRFPDAVKDAAHLRIISF